MVSRRRRDEDRPRRSLREQPLSRLFPNMITLAGLCCGLSAVRFAMAGRWELSVAFIVAAAIIDGMDGRVARMLGATSQFGAQLDSLSDFVCFGVAPVLTLYIWQLNQAGDIGWAVVLFFSVCAALRLARFNTALLDQKKEAWEKQFFTGIPSPAGGILALFPMVLSIVVGHSFAPHIMVTIAHVLIIGALMASRIPTFAGKHMRIKHEFVLPFMIVASILLVVFIIQPWLLLCLVSVAYIVSIYFSIRLFRKLKRASSAEIQNVALSEEEYTEDQLPENYQEYPEQPR
ncbi:MAG: phosphatidylcholine/phosphatidylserine synthase [Proteobacteria bacterium]|nr:phosphatidylcholine/phosphatidylserine synthase [Pseudomonadota bacterium]